MPIPESAKHQLQELLVDHNTLTESNLESFLEALDSDKPVNWNLMLNSEITEGDEDETNS